MSSLKQVIINAILKVSSANPAHDREGEPSAEEARDMFIAALMAELFPSEEQVQVVSVPATLPERVAARKATKEEKAAEKAAKAAEKEAAKAAKLAEKEAKKAAKETKAPSPKKSPEEKAAEKEAAKAEKAAAKEAEKAAKAAAKEAEKAAKEAAKEAEKAAKKAEKEAKKAEKVASSPKSSPAEKKEAKAAAKEAEKEAKKAAKEAEKAASKAEKAAGAALLPASPKKAAKKSAGGNLPKIDPTWRKHLKKADKDHAKELEPALLTYLNAMSSEEFNGKPAEEHVAEFLASRGQATADDGKVETDLEVVEFEGKEYYVNPETKRVYVGEGVYDAETGWTNYTGVGYVGMAAFAEMKLDA